MGGPFGPLAPAPPDLGYGGETIPDPLAPTGARFMHLLNAYEALKQSKEEQMGYYQAGDVGGAAMSGARPGGTLGPTATVSHLDPSADVRGPHDRRASRMNPTNIHALRRAMRRVTRFAHLAKSVMQFTQHHKMKTRRKRRFGR